MRIVLSEQSVMSLIIKTPCADEDAIVKSGEEDLSRCLETTLLREKICLLVLFSEYMTESHFLEGSHERSDVQHPEDKGRLPKSGSLYPIQNHFGVPKTDKSSIASQLANRSAPQRANRNALLLVHVPLFQQN